MCSNLKDIILKKYVYVLVYKCHLIFLLWNNKINNKIKCQMYNKNKNKKYNKQINKYKKYNIKIMIE